MNRGVLLAALLGLVCACLYFDLLKRFKDGSTIEKPHIIYFLVDDLGFNDVSWNNPTVQMPRLQELAEQGVILDNFYSQPVCTPSRVALLTGMYPYHVGSQHGILIAPSSSCMARDRRLLPDLLRDLGYSTYMAGKWHMGYCNVNCTPTYRGFDRFSGFYQGFMDHYNHKAGPGYDWHEGIDIDYSSQGIYSTKLITSRVVEMLEEHDRDQPSFTFVSYAAGHTPYQAPQKYLDLYPEVEETFRRTYLGMVSAVDESVGTIVDTLKKLDMYENSVLVFSSDNGAEFVGEGLGGGSNRPLRGAKCSLYEGGCRVPAFFHSHRMARRTYRHQGLLHISDWFSTLLSLASGVIAEDIDGLDQSQMLLHGEDSSRQEIIYNIDQSSVPFFGDRAIRIGDYKLILGFPGTVDGWESDGSLCLSFLKDFLLEGTKAEEPAGHRTRTASAFLQTDHLGNVDYDGILSESNVAPYSNLLKDNVMLFNLKEDPEERHNLAALMPRKVRELRTRLKEVMSSAQPPTPDMIKANPAGLPKNHNGAWVHGWC